MLGYVPVATAVAYGNNRFVAAAGSGLVVSDDGLDWRQIFPWQQFWGAEFSGVAFGNGQFVAVGRPGLLRETAMTSADRWTWTPGGTLKVKGVSSITFGNGLFVAVGENDGILTSSDGVNWTQTALSVQTSNQYAAGVFV